MTHFRSIHLPINPKRESLAAVATNETRYLSIEKSFRGAVVTVVFFTMMVFYIGLNMIPTVQGAEPTEPQWGEIVTALKEIAKAQTEIAQTQKEIANVMTSMQTNMQTNLKGLESGLALFIKELDKASKDSFKSEPTSEPVGIIKSLANMLVLINRVKQDSDTVRIDNDVPAGSGLITTSIHDDLVLIHKALAAVPHMANEMHIMNMYMSVMSRDMDSTMGRMGRMMPGGWW